MTKGAVVLKIHKSQVCVLTDEGEYLTLPARRLSAARYVGQHVTLPPRQCHLKRICAVVAASLLLIAVSVFFCQPPAAHAWLTLDGDSSLELLIDRNRNIIDIRSLNEGGRAFLNWCDSENIDFDVFLRQFLAWMEQNEDTALLVTTTANSKSLNALLDDIAAGNVSVTVVTVYPQTRLEAEKLGISPGRALLLAGAVKQGLSVDIDEIREDNPLLLLNERGLNIDQVTQDSSDPDQQADSIRSLNPPKNKPPSGEPDDQNKQPPDDADGGNAGSSPGNRDENQNDENQNDETQGEQAEPSEPPTGEEEIGADKDGEESRTGPPDHANAGGRDKEADMPSPVDKRSDNQEQQNRPIPPAHANARAFREEEEEEEERDSTGPPGPPAHATARGNQKNDDGERGGPPAHAAARGRRNHNS